MTTLALDLGTTTGFALYASGITSSGSVSFARYKGCKSKPADHRGQPFLSFHRWLRETILTTKATQIAYEEVHRWSSGDAAKVYGGFRGVLMMNAAFYGIEVTGYSPTEIKKAFTGKGMAEKEQMIVEAMRRYPDEVVTCDNQADALAILSLHLATLT